MEHTMTVTRDSRGRFRAIMRYRDAESGAWRQRNKTLPASVTSKRAATKAAREWAESLADAIGAETEAGRMTVAAYVREYWRSLAATGAIEASTARARSSWVSPVDGSPLGSRRMCDVTPRDLERYVAGLRGRYAPVTAACYYRAVSQPIRHAAETGDIPADPCARVRGARAPKPSPNALTPDQCREVAAKLAAMPPTPVATAALVALHTGLRVGEVCALTWRDVDTARGVIHVRHAIGRADGGTYLKEPKSACGRRDVPISPALGAALARRLAAMTSERASAGLATSREDLAGLYVVGDATPVAGGKPWASPAAVSREWHVLAVSWDLKGSRGRLCTFHDLRHTFATLAVSEGADVKSVSAILGHADAAMTLNVYADSSPDAKRRTADLVACAMAPATGLARTA